MQSTEPREKNVFSVLLNSELYILAEEGQTRRTYYNFLHVCKIKQRQRLYIEKQKFSQMLENISTTQLKKYMALIYKYNK